MTRPIRTRDLRTERKASETQKWEWTAPLELEAEEDDQEDWDQPPGVLLTPTKEQHE